MSISNHTRKIYQQGWWIKPLLSQGNLWGLSKMLNTSFLSFIFNVLSICCCYLFISAIWTRLYGGLVCLYSTKHQLGWLEIWEIGWVNAHWLRCLMIDLVVGWGFSWDCWPKTYPCLPSVWPGLLRVCILRETGGKPHTFCSPASKVKAGKMSAALY